MQPSEDILCFRCGKPAAEALDVAEDQEPCSYCLERLLEAMPSITPCYGFQPGERAQPSDEALEASRDDAGESPDSAV